MQKIYVVNLIRINEQGEIYPQNFVGLSRNEAFKQACKFLISEFPEEKLSLPSQSIDFITDDEIVFQKHLGDFINIIETYGVDHFEIDELSFGVGVVEDKVVSIKYGG